MSKIDEQIIKYSQELAILYLEMKNGKYSCEMIEKLSQSLDELIIEKMTFSQKD